MFLTADSEEKPIPTKAEVKTQKTASGDSKAVKTFRLYESKSGNITEISAADYIVGVVAAEMPALYDTEALKAQAIAAYTYAVSRKNDSNDYDVTDDPQNCQGYCNEAQMQEKWGEKAPEYKAKINSAVNEVAGLVLTYDGKPIRALYHAVSCGKTEDVKNVWGKELPYLKSVSSEADRLSPSYISTAEFTAEEIKQKLAKKVKLEGKAEKFFGKPTLTDAGYVKSISVGDKTLTGGELREALGLKSSAFSVKFEGEKFIFTVYGYGHGVGMSQFGADQMAKTGSSYKEILLHYYTGAKIEKLSE